MKILFMPMATAAAAADDDDDGEVLCIVYRVDCQTHIWSH